MNERTPAEFTVTLPKKTMETIVTTLVRVANSNVVTAHEAYDMLRAVEDLKEQISGTGFTLDVVFTEHERKRRWKR